MHAPGTRHIVHLRDVGVLYDQPGERPAGERGCDSDDYAAHRMPEPLLGTQSTQRGAKDAKEKILLVHFTTSASAPHL
jgi:hypothetical protein